VAALRPTLFQHAAALSQLLPPVVSVAAGRLASPARRWMVVWCLGLVTQEAVAVAIGRQGEPNLWVAYVFLPITGATALWTLSLWQSGTTARLALRLAIPLFVVTSAVLSFRADDPRAFSMFAAPFHAIVLLLAATWTFVHRSLTAHDALWRQDWFWAAGGLMLYGGASTAIQPLTSYLLSAGREDLLLVAFNARAAMEVLAFAAITGGMLCPVPRSSSGGSSSPPSSPLASSSAPSASRW
jgi:hypothetical protein